MRCCCRRTISRSRRAEKPAVRLDEDDLFDLAWHRAQGTLRAALRAKADRLDSAKSRRGSMRSPTWRGANPFAFYARLLGAAAAASASSAGSARKPNDALDEFLNLALDYERRETPSLQGFVAWLRAAQTEVKRDMEIARDEVRVMTVHGAKGLEAPIVILADTTTQPTGPREPRLLRLPVDECGARRAAAARLGRTQGNDARRRDARARARATRGQDEYRRLLYVAMTRAPSGLTSAARAACSTHAGRAAGTTWSATRSSRTRSRRSPTMTAKTCGAGARPPDASVTAAAAGGQPRATALPAWLDNGRRPRRRTRRRHAIDALDGRAAAAGTASDAQALARGTPGAPADAVAARLAARAPRRGRAAAISRARQGIREASARPSPPGARHPRRSALRPCSRRAAAPRCRSSGMLPAGRPTAVRARSTASRSRRERADRRLQDQPPAPARLEDVPPDYVAQLALYRALLRATLSRPDGARGAGLDRKARSDGNSGRLAGCGTGSSAA